MTRYIYITEVTTFFMPTFFCTFDNMLIAFHYAWISEYYVLALFIYLIAEPV